MARIRLLIAAVMLGTMLLVPATASAAPPSATAVTIPVTQTVPGVSSFVGQFNLTRISVVNGALSAAGTLTGTLTNLVTGATAQVNQAFTVPLAVTGTCDILHLTLGPLDLNLLGLVVHLDRIVLDITAQSGPGNLLGNLLCAVAHLLDGPSPLNALVAHLNRILRLLG
jgi:hypothetical protein